MMSYLKCFKLTLKSCVALLLTLSSLSSTLFAAPGDVLESFSIVNTTDPADGRTPTTHNGIEFHDGYIWVLDYSTDRIYRVYPQQVLDDDGITVLANQGESDFNIPVPDNLPNAAPICGSQATCTGGGSLTFANNFFWNASPVTDDIIKIDPVDGDNLESENTLSTVPFPSPVGMTYDGTNFWIVDWQSNTINRVRPEDGAVLSTIPGPSQLPSWNDDNTVTHARPFGITWDGQALWVSEQEEDRIYRVDPLDGSILNFFDSPAEDPFDLAWDGEFLWHVDRFTATIYKIESGVIPFGIIGCMEKNGIGINGEVLLSQNAEPDQNISADADGCFVFPTFASGVPLSLTVSESGNDKKPVLSLVDGDVILLVGDTYSDPGVIALDEEDGEISADVVAVPDIFNQPGLIDTSAPGPVGGTTITYNVIDSIGNAADPITRQVFVLEVDVVAPVITLNGDNPFYVEQASSYVEPGATATDTRDGDLSSSITVTGSVNAAVAGTYTLDYDVTDAAGNAATTVTRTVIVQDTTIPVITLTGADPITVERGDAYTELGATASDNIDGDISGSISITGSVSNNVVGSYILTYNVSDVAGNAATTVTRTVNVVDTTAPIITLLGATSINHELNEVFVDPGYTASDAPGDDLTGSVVVTGSVNTSLAGSYDLIYSLADAAGNAAISQTRTVIVADRTAPEITITGDNPVQHELGTNYVDAGATASDLIDGDVTGSIVVGGDAVDGLTEGSFTITYDVTDAAGNAAITASRSVIVGDATPPIVTLLGSAIVQQELGVAYVDAGATASDNTGGDLTANIVIGGDTVDTNTVGDYTITYQVADGSGNSSSIVTRLVEVADRTIPVITLTGSNPLQHEVGSIYTDPGATANDNIDNDITGRIGVTGSVNASVLGTYTLNYNVTDLSGNAAVTVSRTVNVVDTGVPAISLIGSNPILHELQTAFIDPGATAIDAADGDLTGAIVATGAVDSNIAGTYTLTYNVVDSQSNAAPTVTRDVIVADRTAPIITLTGAATIVLEQGDSFTDPGATAADIIDGDLSVSIITGGSVNTTVPGSYTLTYNVADAAGNNAVEVTRTVIVSDTTIPVITLIGPATLDHEVDNVFVDPGATALDNIDGDITGSITTTGSVNASVIGTYTINYFVSDSSGNNATSLSRTVNVVDTGAPSIALIGNNPILHELQTPFTDPGATASDAADGDLTGSITITGSVDPNIAATYTLTYDVLDSQSNPATTVTRDVIVADRTAPVIALLGAATINVEQGDTFTDPGTTATDIIDGDLSLSVVSGGTVNTNIAGSYTLTYDVADAAGNNANQVTRTVVVSDTTIPVITLTGASPFNHEVNTVFVDPGASALDNIDGDISGSITTTGGVNASVIGSYTINYNVTDSSGNNATTVSRSVNVIDTGAPSIGLIGANPLLHELQTPFVDPGATASDAVDGDLSGSITVTGTVNPNIAGTYTLTYDVVDSQSNPAPTVTRDVIVADRTGPVITLIGSTTINLEQGTAFTDPGATATDTIDGDVSLNIVVGGSVNPSVAGTYVVTYDVSDAAGNNAIQVSRTVIVSDTTAPVITLSGGSPIDHEVNTVFVDPGAGAVDNIDGNISGNITTTGGVNASVIGSYSINYNVSDSSGNNAATVTRTVNVIDTGAPSIALIGDNPVLHELQTPFVEPGFIASDASDGDITGSVVATGSVDVNTVGTYTLTYNVVDSQSNAAPTVTRDVIVADRTKPTITLLGSTTVNHEQNTAYTDAGATAADNIDGDLSGIVVQTGNVAINSAGTYLLNFNVIDSSGNAADTIIRTVIVADTTAPIISLIGNASVAVEQGSTYSDPGATATDNLDGNLTSSIVVSGDIVDPNTAGIYTVRYDVIDAAGNNAAQVIRTVTVSDTTAPTLSLVGSAVINAEQGTSYTDAGATANDVVDGVVSVTVGGDIVDINTAGTYVITYDVQDSAGNISPQIIRTVNVADTTGPAITLTGAASIDVEQGSTYTEQGATALDSVDGTVSVTIAGDIVDANTAGTYIVTYDAVDVAGNSATQLTRTVNVADTIAPTITLTGNSAIDLPIGDLYVEPGFTALDNTDGDLSGSVTISGSIDINTEGSYVLSYDVTDAGGNAATTQTRTINVVTPVAIFIEAETATISASHTVESTNSGFTGPGYIQYAGEGDIEFTFDAFELSYDLVVRYAWDTGDRPLEVILNGQSLGLLAFPATGSLTTWAPPTTALTLDLQSGSNTLRFVTTGSSGANLDSLTITPQ